MVVRHLPASTVAALLGSWASPSGPAYRSLADGLRLLIQDGRVPPGARMPSERDLTVALRVSRTTVTSAYRDLRDRGYLVSRRGSGSIASVPSAVGPDQGRHHAPMIDTAGLYDLTVTASPAVCGIGTAMTAALEELPRYLATPGYHPFGLPELRTVIAERYEQRGLPTSPDQIIVTPGAVSATSIVISAFAGFGDRVLTDSPTYPNTIDAIGRCGARIAAAPMAPDGWDLPLLEATVRQAAPRAAWLVVDFQNPTGHLMPDADRERLAGVLARSRTITIVDETLVDLSLDAAEDELPAPYASFDPNGVITVGSVSKAFWGGLRIGWIRAPERLVPAILDARASMDLGAAVLEQLAVAALLRDRVKLLAERRTGLVEQRAALLAAVRTELPDWRFTPPGGGLSLWCELPAPVGSVLVALAERHGVLLMSGSRFSPDGGLDRFIRIPYTLDPDELTEAVGRIAAAYSVAGLSPPRKSAIIA